MSNQRQSCFGCVDHSKQNKTHNPGAITQMAKPSRVTSALSLKVVLFLAITAVVANRAAAQASGGFQSSQPSNTAASIAQIASAGGWDTSLTLVNLSTFPVGTVLNFYDNSGNPLSLPFSFPQGTMSAMTNSTVNGSITASGLLLVDTTGLYTQPANVGWSRLQASGEVGGYALFTNTRTNWQAAVPMQTLNASSYLLAFDNTGALSTGVAIANLATQDANINAIIRDDGGNIIGTESISVPAQGHTSFTMSSTYPVTAGMRGTVEFDTPAGGQINVLGLRANGPALTTVPVLADVGTAGGSMAHLTYSQGWETTFTLVNTGTSSAQATLSFFDDFGTPLGVSMIFPQTGTLANSTTVTKTLAPGASLIVETNGNDNYKSVSGSALLTTTGNVSGFAVFRFDPSQQEAVVPLETRNASSYTVVYDNSNGNATGLALANASDQAETLSLILRDETGAQFAGGSVTLAAHGHTALTMSEAYPGTEGIRGTVQISNLAGTPFSALGIRFTPSQNITTIPVLAK